jgi:hypothetical protein
MNGLFDSRVLSAVSAFLVAVLAAAPVGATPSARSNLYSVAAVNSYCTKAQKVVSNTTLSSINLVHYARQIVSQQGFPLPDIADFTFSSSAPYDGPNLSAYNGKDTPGSALPLTTQQLVTYREVPASNTEIPIIVSCKMKSSEGLQHHFGPGAAGAQSTCKAMNQQTVAAVFATLTSSERRYLVYGESQIIFDDDQFLPSGPTWLGSIPVLIPLLLYVDSSVLHVASPAITVAVDFQDPSVGNDKKGSYYCHFATPEYIRSVVTGQLQPYPRFSF